MLPNSPWSTTASGAENTWNHKPVPKETPKTCPRPTWKETMRGLNHRDKAVDACSDARYHGYPLAVFKGQVLDAVSCEETGWREEDVT